MEPMYPSCQAGASPYPAILLVLSKLIQEDGMESLPTSLPSLQMSQNWKEGSDQMLGLFTKLVPCIRTQDSRT